MYHPSYICILYTGEYAKLLLPYIGNYFTVKYYTYISGRFTLWTYEPLQIMKRAELTAIHKITEDEYYKILALINNGFKPTEAFESVFNL